MSIIEKAIEANHVINHFFQTHPKTTDVMAKELMDDFIEAGIFSKNHRDGLPIRNLLRDLDKANQLHLLPLLRVERKAKNRNWYFTASRHFETN